MGQGLAFLWLPQGAVTSFSPLGLCLCFPACVTHQPEAVLLSQFAPQISGSSPGWELEFWAPIVRVIFPSLWLSFPSCNYGSGHAVSLSPSSSGHLGSMVVGGELKGPPSLQPWVPFVPHPVHTVPSPLMHIWPCSLGQSRGEMRVGAEILPTPSHVPQLRAHPPRRSTDRLQSGFGLTGTISDLNAM